jgi:[acyl-carrier-protein] S-malonyltransferase
MGRTLYEREPAARAVFDQADVILGYALSTLCFAGPAEELTDTANQQPALYVTGVAAWRVIEEQGASAWPPADYFAGTAWASSRRSRPLAALTLPMAWRWSGAAAS